MFEQEARILDRNLEFLGFSMAAAMENAGAGAAREAEKRFGRGNKIAVFCGLGNNGGDGLCASRFLSERNDVDVFLAGRKKEVKSRESRRNLELLEKMGKEIVEIKDSRDVGKIRGKYDIILDCLLGIGAEPPLREPVKSVVTKINGIEGKKIAVDLPTPGFGEDVVFSMHMKKKKGAVVIPIGVPKELEKIVGPGDFLELREPEEKSHKGENGKLLIIGGSERYYGAPLYAAIAASHFVDLIYYSSTEENNKAAKKLMKKTPELILVPRKDFKGRLEDADCVLVGPGIGKGKKVKEIVDAVVESGKKSVIDADALRFLGKEKIHGNCILTPHKKEFERIFGNKPNAENIEEMAKKYGCTILGKQPEADIISDGKRVKKNIIHNKGMTKGGTGDTLAGLAGAFACKNDVFISACAAAFINGLSAELLKNEHGHYFSAAELAGQVGKTAAFVRGRG